MLLTEQLWTTQRIFGILNKIKSKKRRAISPFFRYVDLKKVLLQKLGCILAPSDEGAVERSEPEGDKSQSIYLSLFFLSLRHGKAVPPPSSEGGGKC